MAVRLRQSRVDAHSYRTVEENYRFSYLYISRVSNETAVVIGLAEAAIRLKTRTAHHTPVVPDQLEAKL